MRERTRVVVTVLHIQTRATQTIDVTSPKIAYNRVVRALTADSALIVRSVVVNGVQLSNGVAGLRALAGR